MHREVRQLARSHTVVDPGFETWRTGSTVQVLRCLSQTLLLGVQRLLLFGDQPEKMIENNFRLK